MFFESQFGNSLFIGLVSNLVMSTLMVIYRVSRRAPLNIPLLLGKLVAGTRRLSENNLMRIGIVLHLLVGMFWGPIYWYTIPAKSIFSGLLFAMVPWFLMMAVLLPILGQGFFGSKINKYVPEVYLVLHAIYGMILGYLATL